MKGRLLLTLTTLVLSFNLVAASNDTCRGLEGLWMGKFSYKDLSLCQLKHPELCNKVGLAVGIRPAAEENMWVADLYPQRGIAASVNMTCENGKLIPVSMNATNVPGAAISYQCDDQDNCMATYEDFRLKALLVKMWTEDARI